MNYEEAARLHARARDPHAGKPIANNTRVMRIDRSWTDPGYAIKLHATNVVTFERDGSMVLSTGGWDTMTTVDRINYADGICAFTTGQRAGEPATFVKLGGHRYDGTSANEAVRVGTTLHVMPDGSMHGYDETYGEYLARQREEANERRRRDRELARENALDVIVGNPQHPRGWWYEVRAGHLRVENGVIFSGQHPVAVCYPHPEQGVQANVLTVSQRALKRTRVGLELVERAAANGCKLVFESHGVVIEEAQNRATKL